MYQGEKHISLPNLISGPKMSTHFVCETSVSNKISLAKFSDRFI